MDKKADILIVDDSPTNLTFLFEILNNTYNIRPTTNGKLAIESAKHKCPNLIILDISMPDMDGYEVCQVLKSDQTTKNVPIIFISGYASEPEKAKALEVGGVDLILKPFNSTDLINKIEYYLEKSV